MFGDDVDVFRPERWLCAEEKRREMEKAMFSFGYGKYACLGRNVARMEVWKVVAGLVKEFEVCDCSLMVGRRGEDFANDYSFPSLSPIKLGC